MARKLEQLHWTIDRAAAEFGIDRATLPKRMKAAGIEPTFKDGTFSTLQICAAIYSDKEAEQTEKIREEKMKLQRERMLDEKRLLPAEEVRTAFEKMATALKSEILSSMRLMQDEKDSMLKSLQSSIDAVVGVIGKE